MGGVTGTCGDGMGRIKGSSDDGGGMDRVCGDIDGCFCCVELHCQTGTSATPNLRHPLILNPHLLFPQTPLVQ